MNDMGEGGDFIDPGRDLDCLEVGKFPCLNH